MAGKLSLPAIVFACCYWTTASLAQETDLQPQVDAAIAALTQLDGLANSCLQALDGDSADLAQQRCTEFMTAVDGELLANYLAQCEILKSWRDTYVLQAIENSASPATDADTAQALRNLVGADYACAADALQQRTRFVTTAFRLLQDGQNDNGRSNAALNRRLAELQFDATLNSERRSLLNSVEQQRLRREQETQRQMNQLENELIRQQLNRPN